MGGKVHGCSEVRVGVLARTLCGVEVMQTLRNQWETERGGQPIKITRNAEKVTCERCHYVRG